MSIKRRQMLVICPYPQGVAAGQRLKYEQYFDDWDRLGWDITVSPYMDLRMWESVYLEAHYVDKALGLLRGHARRLRDLVRVRRYDLVYVFMWVTPLGTSALERLMRKLARSMIYDIEDNILIDHTPPPAVDRRPFSRLLRSTGKARYLVRTADHVITSSPFLNEACLKINERRQSTYISSSIDTDRFVPANCYSNLRKVTIGWTGTFSSMVYLDLLRPVFQELAKRLDYKLKVIGNFDYEVPGVDLEVVRWTREKEVEDLQSIDIGVYPLPINDWVLGKSGLKAIQYMAFGIPPVATSVGTTTMLIRNGENGILVSTKEEWLAALERLVRDCELRRRLGTAARRDAVNCYSTKAIAAHYRSVLERVSRARSFASSP